ncbi:MAG: 2OG-Fe(II) oxygenase [Alphaproteobacteria bacterium]|nr:2OG-Fe(II) oxygenase [Alphaproteobacteria bacterium]
MQRRCCGFRGFSTHHFARSWSGWRDQGNAATGTIDSRDDDHLGAQSVAETKRRRDHEIVDAALNQRLAEVFRRRVVPEVAKAFQYHATRTTGFKIGCYLDERTTGGYFRPHRDNISASTAHRRFAVSLLLNDPAEYEGGSLRFPEFGQRDVRPGVGEAVVFSCSLLHEVTDVRRGKRFVLLTFLTSKKDTDATQGRGAG